MACLCPGWSYCLQVQASSASYALAHHIYCSTLRVLADHDGGLAIVQNLGLTCLAINAQH